MDTALLEELEAIGQLIRQSGLPQDAQSTALWCLGLLPGLYHQFRETNNTHHGDEICRLVEGVRKALAGAAGDRDVVTDRLVAMHARLGIPPLKLTPIKKPRKRKAS